MLCHRGRRPPRQVVVPLVELQLARGHGWWETSGGDEGFSLLMAALPVRLQRDEMLHDCTPAASMPPRSPCHAACARGYSPSPCCLRPQLLTLPLLLGPAIPLQIESVVPGSFKMFTP